MRGRPPPWLADAVEGRNRGEQWNVIGKRVGVTEDVVRCAVRRWQQTKPTVKVCAEPPQAPAVHIHGNHGAVSDLQIPFHHPKALEFVQQVRRDYFVPRDNMLCVGDETDQLHGSHFPKDPDGQYSPTTEIEAARHELRRWYEAFPRLRIAISNHGLRWLKKATAAEIPTTLLRDYREIVGAPDGWEWRDQWIIDGGKEKFKLIHGHEGAQGIHAARQKALDEGMNVVFGHLHASGGVAHVHTQGFRAWGLNTGCLIDREAYAFKYDKAARFRPTLGMGVIVDGGRTPIFVPFDG